MHFRSAIKEVERADKVTPRLAYHAGGDKQVRQLRPRRARIDEARLGCLEIAAHHRADADKAQEARTLTNILDRSQLQAGSITRRSSGRFGDGPENVTTVFVDERRLGITGEGGVARPASRGEAPEVSQLERNQRESVAIRPLAKASPQHLQIAA